MGKKPRLTIVVDGDSWHDLPKLGFKLPGYGGSDFDVARGLDALGHEVKNYARWGHTIKRIVKDKGYLEGLKRYNPDVILVDGGGNDMFDKQRMNKIFRNYDKKRKPLEYIKMKKFKTLLKPILKHYRTMFSDIRAQPNGKTIPIICHSYDFVIPRAPYPWLFEPMQFHGIFEAAGKPVKKGLAEAIAKELVKKFHKELKKVTKEYQEIYLVKLHGVVGSKKKYWHDEIHPRKAGFLRVSRALEKQALLVTQKQSQALTV